jgi:transcriptional regulator with XRE-family HTH domain
MIDLRCWPPASSLSLPFDGGVARGLREFLQMKLLLVNCVMSNEAGESSPNGGSGANNASKVDQLVGRRIRLRRLLLQIELAHLANDLGLSAPLLACFEAGEQRPHPVMLARIASYLGVNVTWFFRDFSVDAAGRPALADPTQAAGPGLQTTRQLDIANELLELLDQFIQLTDPADRQAILTFTRDRVVKQGNSPVLLQS